MIHWLTWDGLHLILNMQRYPNNIDSHKSWLQCSHRSIKLSSHYYGVDNSTEWLQRVSVTHIWGYRGDSSQLKPCKGINLTTRHTRARRAPRVATVHNAVKETIRAHLTLVHVFHTYASADTLWVAHALSHFTLIRYGRIASVSAVHEATQFAGPHKIPYAPVHNLNLLIRARRSVLNRHRRGLPPWSSKF
jgi:hypothetical protein